MAHAEVNYNPNPRSDDVITPRRYGGMGNLHGDGDPNGVVNGRPGWSYYDDLSGGVYYNTGSGYSSVWTIQAVGGGDVAEPPIGSIQAWHKSLTGVPVIPDGWVECNGQVLSDAESPLDGQTIPNINGSGGLFIRGGASSGTIDTGGSEDDAAVDQNADGITVSVRSSFYEPTYFVAVWIMRVK